MLPLSWAELFETRSSCCDLSECCDDCISDGAACRSYGGMCYYAASLLPLELRLSDCMAIEDYFLDELLTVLAIENGFSLGLLISIDYSDSDGYLSFDFFLFSSLYSKIYMSLRFTSSEARSMPCSCAEGCLSECLELRMSDSFIFIRIVVSLGTLIN